MLVLSSAITHNHVLQTAFHFQTPLFETLRQVPSNVWAKHMRDGVSAILHNRTGILSCNFFTVKDFSSFSISGNHRVAICFSYVAITQFRTKLPYYQSST